METWSVDEVCSWLVEKNLGELVHRFQEEEVSGAALLALNDRMVQQLVKKIGHQAVLMDLIKKYKQESPRLESLGSPRETAPLAQGGAALEDEQSPSPANCGKQTPSFYAAETLNNGRIDQRVLKQRERKSDDKSPWPDPRTTVNQYPNLHSENNNDDTFFMVLLWGPLSKNGQCLRSAEHSGNLRKAFSALQSPLQEHYSRRNVKHVLARNKALQWTKSYVLPEFPYDVKCMLAEQKCPDHSMRIRIIEFLQADMTKYLEGSLYPSTQQYNDVVNALLQAHPFLDEDGCGFDYIWVYDGEQRPTGDAMDCFPYQFLWKRALKDRFKYVRRPIEDDEQVMRNKCKFGHRRGQTKKSLADISFDEVKIVQIKEETVCLDSEADEHISWFQQEYMKTEKDWKEIDKRMSQTLEIRRKLIGSRTPLKDILKMFPFLKCPYQMFREFQLLTRTDIYKKTKHILESYSENILTSFSVVDNPINIALQEKMKQHTDEDMLKHMKMTATCLLLPDVFGDDPSLFVIVNKKVQVSTPVLEVKNPFNIGVCEFSLYLEKEKLTKVDDCVMALAALIAAYHVFGVECPRRLSQTLNFLETLIFDMHCPYFPSMKEKEKEVGFQPPVT